MGRIRAEDEDLATVPFLASDNEEEDDDKTATGRYGVYINAYLNVVLCTASYLKEAVVLLFIIFLNCIPALEISHMQDDNYLYYIPHFHTMISEGELCNSLSVDIQKFE